MNAQVAVFLRILPNFPQLPPSRPLTLSLDNGAGPMDLL
jgi:hypothetical protein